MAWTAAAPVAGRGCAPFPANCLAKRRTGPANLRLGLQQSFAEILDAAARCSAKPDCNVPISEIVACLALAGASEPTYLAAAQSFPHPFRRTIVTTDAHAACLGAHGDNDGGVIVAGTGTVGWAVVGGQIHRVGGWGMPISDEGSGAWLGCEAVRRLLWALDGRIGWTGLLRTLGDKFDNDPHAIVAWAHEASPPDSATLAPWHPEHAAQDDPIACELVSLAARHIDILADRLIAIGATRLALVGGCGTLPHSLAR